MKAEGILHIKVEKSVWHDRDMSKEIFKELEQKETNIYVLEGYTEDTCQSLQHPAHKTTKRIQKVERKIKEVCVNLSGCKKGYSY